MYLRKLDVILQLSTFAHVTEPGEEYPILKRETMNIKTQKTITSPKEPCDKSKNQEHLPLSTLSIINLCIKSIEIFLRKHRFYLWCVLEPADR
jgi:hypothetical protein